MDPLAHLSLIVRKHILGEPRIDGPTIIDSEKTHSGSHGSIGPHVCDCEKTHSESHGSIGPPVCDGEKTHGRGSHGSIGSRLKTKAYIYNGLSSSSTSWFIKQAAMSSIDAQDALGPDMYLEADPDFLEHFPQ